MFHVDADVDVLLKFKEAFEQWTHLANLAARKMVQPEDDSWAKEGFYPLEEDVREVMKSIQHLAYVSVRLHQWRTSVPPSAAPDGKVKISYTVKGFTLYVLRKIAPASSYPTQYRLRRRIYPSPFLSTTISVKQHCLDHCIQGLIFHVGISVCSLQVFRV